MVMAMAMDTAMKKQTKTKYRIASIICALAFVVFVLLCFVGVDKKTESINKPFEPVNPGSSQTEQTTSTAVYISPIDFDDLQKKNPDIYGWLQIPGTDISYAVLQSQKDDTFYLDHNELGKYDVNGVLFSEHTYNKNDFSDKVTAIYGHHLKSGAMFGNLQKYYTDDFDKYSKIVIYTETKQIDYQVFAAVSFSNRHIMYYYDCFEDELMMKEFLDDINSVRAIGSHVDKSVEVATTDQLLVLSTCLQGDRTCRFLVIGKKID